MRFDRTDPELIHDYLFGGTFIGSGLLNRVSQWVKEYAHDDGPSFRSGSITGMFEAHHEDSAADDQIFQLYLGLRGWLGRPEDSSTLKEYLRKHRLSDAEALVGKDDEKHGLISTVKQQARILLQHPSTANVEKLSSLIVFLIGWMDIGCQHDLHQVDVPEGVLPVMACRCGLKVRVDHHGQLAVL